MTTVPPTADPVGIDLRMTMRAAYSTAHLQLVCSGIEQAIAMLDMGKTQQARDMLRVTLAGMAGALNLSIPVQDAEPVPAGPVRGSGAGRTGGRTSPDRGHVSLNYHQNDFIARGK